MARIAALKTSTITSTVFLCLLLLLLLLGYATNLEQHQLSLSRDFHVGILNVGLDVRIVFFDNAEYGPYRGSIIGFAGDEYPHAIAFGSSFGIYYRHFTWPDSTLWTLTVSVWYPLIAFSILPVLHFVKSRRHRTQNNSK